MGSCAMARGVRTQGIRPLAHLGLLLALAGSATAVEVFQWSTRQEGHKEEHGVTGTAFGVSCLVGVHHLEGRDGPADVALPGATEAVLVRDCGPLKRRAAGEWVRVGDPDNSFPGRPDEAFPILMAPDGTVFASDEEETKSLNS